MKHVKKKINSIWIAYLPFLLLFIIIVLKLNNDELVGDEARYIMYAQNLLNGFYSPKDEINLWNGPGYPIFIMPFIALKLPLISIPLANAFLQYLSIIFLYKTILAYTYNKKLTSLVTSFWAFYYIAYQELPLILTEPLASCLVVMIIFLSQKYLSRIKSPVYGLLAGLSLGFLVLTKIIFGYVLIVVFITLAITSLFAFLFNVSFSLKLNKIINIYFIAFLTISPYLLYTYSLTNRFPYFSNSGGMSLYWMSTPFENEYGDWNNEDFNANCNLGQPCNADKFRVNHQTEIDYIKGFKGVEKDDMYKKIAIDNIRKHPLKYIKNCFSNISRLLFGIPNSYFYQRDVTIIRIIPNAFLLVACILAVILWIYNFKLINIELNVFVFFVSMYLLFSVVVSAHPRQFYIIVPALLVLIGTTFNGRVKITLRS